MRFFDMLGFPAKNVGHCSSRAFISKAGALFQGDRQAKAVQYTSALLSSNPPIPAAFVVAYCSYLFNP